jgi:DNA polymerase III delta subunit
LLLERSSRIVKWDPPRDAVEEDSWVEKIKKELKKKLQPEVADLFKEERSADTRDAKFDDQACRCAFNLLAW